MVVWVRLLTRLWLQMGVLVCRPESSTRKRIASQDLPDFLEASLTHMEGTCMQAGTQTKLVALGRSFLPRITS